jgi:alpha-glucosidase
MVYDLGTISLQLFTLPTLVIQLIIISMVLIRKQENGYPDEYCVDNAYRFYLDTRYYEIDPSSGDLTLVTSSETNTSSTYKSYSHGVFLRNAHGQEILMRPTNITWRTLGGSIDLYFFDGPTQPDVTKQYQTGAIGLPAMQQYFTFGYHQCRWGYQNWTVLQEVVDNFKKFDIPLENIWTDIGAYTPILNDIQSVCTFTSCDTVA